MALKLNNECNMYRLVSPNYQGEFEFSVAKNGGVEYFNVDCSYKPYNPYIHVNPNFKNMYGQDFDDSRGLICNGDFSFGMISDKFAEYELQNKNYQATFDRQIQNMDVNNALALKEQAYTQVAGVIKSGLMGAASGGMVGGIGGAIAGGVAGTALSSVGTVVDRQLTLDKMKETKDFTIDMYNFSLQNIKALPYSLSRCSALTYNNKLYPFIEVYGCTEEEEQALINKLIYDGMTVNIIGTINDYSGNQSLVRGELIRMTDINEDSEIINAIYKELQKGVYL